ncbi:MAG TPA: hypothetical protein VKU19_14935 [Bryobacteraceae bacterium]|nr:hypothetical protein [Bryobacteraceae bacterium]
MRPCIFALLSCASAFAQSVLYSPMTVPLANEGATGTTNAKLVKGTGAPLTAIVAGTSDTTGILGIAWSGGGTTGNVLYAPVSGPGIAPCIFDGATTANHLVIASTTTGGDCHDSGVAANGTCPSVQVLGVVTSTNGAGGTYNVALGTTCPGGSSSGGSSVASGGYLQLGPWNSYGNYVAISNQLQPWGFVFTPEVGITMSTITLTQGAASGTCAGTCGLVAALYNVGLTSKLAQTNVVTSGGTPNYNASTQKLTLTFASPPTLTAGTPYVLVLVTDSTVATFGAAADIAGGFPTLMAQAGLLGYCNSNNGTGAGGTVSAPASCSDGHLSGYGPPGWYAVGRP